MITFRRKLLDESLARWSSRMSSPTLDIGGKKHGKRGVFRPPQALAKGWKYANLDPSGKPDTRCRAERLPFKDGAFGTIVMTEVLEYLEDPRGTFTEVNRVLRGGGMAFLSVPFLVPVHFDSEFDLSRQTISGLKALVASSGLAIEALEPMGSTLAVIHDLLTISCGYASPNRGSLANRAVTRLLSAVAGLAGRLDPLLKSQSGYITTGYFLVLRKPGDVRR